MNFREKLKIETKRCLDQSTIDMMMDINKKTRAFKKETDKIFKIEETIESEMLNKLNFKLRRSLIDGDLEEGIKEIEDLIATGQFPERFSDNFLSCGLYLREFIIPCWGYALITNKFIETLSSYLKGKKVLEVMAGRGLLSALLREKEIDTICTDSNDWGGSSEEYAYTEIEIIEAEEAVRKYGENIDHVLMVWPPMKEDHAYRVIKALREVNPTASVIYIGENGGCTADKNFFNIVKNVEDSSFRNVQSSYDQFYFLNDRPYLVK